MIYIGSGHRHWDPQLACGHPDWARNGLVSDVAEAILGVVNVHFSCQCCSTCGSTVDKFDAGMSSVNMEKGLQALNLPIAT